MFRKRGSALVINSPHLPQKLLPFFTHLLSLLRFFKFHLLATFTHLYQFCLYPSFTQKFFRQGSMVVRRMVPKRCPYLNSWSLWICYLTWRKGLCRCDYTMGLEIEDYPALFEQAKCNYKGFCKRMQEGLSENRR